MFEFKISSNAKEDLKRIYAYGYSEFEEAQADTYYHGFFDMFEKISTNPYLFQSVDHIRPGYRRCAYCSDNIYYRVNGTINGTIVEIMAILGGQDIDSWL